MEYVLPAGIEPGQDGEALITKNGEATWSTVGGGGHREVLMASGITPPEPLISTDNTDWLYGEA